MIGFAVYYLEQGQIVDDLDVEEAEHQGLLRAYRNDPPRHRTTTSLPVALLASMSAWALPISSRV